MTNIVLFHLYDKIYSIQNCKTERVKVVAEDGVGDNGEVLFSGYRVSVL